MKGHFFIAIIGLMSAQTIAQDVINPYPPPYDDYTGMAPPGYTVPSSQYTFNVQDVDNYNYGGEYLADFKELWWLKPAFNSYYKSLKVEIVGFPFMMDCIFTGGCADGSTTTRILEMPYSALSNDQWGNIVWRIKDFPAIMIANLVTNVFNSPNPIDLIIGPGPWFPHAVTKFTLYIHCGNNANSDLVDSLVFTYDLNRGRMRDYPFMPINAINQGSTSWDVIFFARLIYKEYGNGHEYTETTNEDIYIHGKTLNYYPVPPPISNCPDFIDPTWPTFYSPPDWFFSIRTAPYCLTSFLPYRSFTEDLAGYELNSNNLYDIDDGIRHTYVIQNNYDISEINPSQKVVYNPPEVDITASDLYFPSGYTFKTIRGVYPVLSEVALSMGADGNYHDLRDVPVFTDLTGEDANDATNDNPTRAGRYYIKSGGQLTIEPCVTIYDATFLIESGGTLIFQDRESTYGRFEVFEEDGSGTYTFTNQQGVSANYKLIGKQGTVIRPVSLVPVGNTFLYESNDLIESGTQQLPADLNLPNTIASETHVVFVAENEVKLSPGFVASADHSPSGESVFHALIWPSHCGGSGNRLAPPGYNNSQTNFQPQKYLYPTNPVLSPNPSSQNSKLYFSVLEQSKVSVKLYNSMGQLVNTPLTENVKEKGNHIVEINTFGLQPGIYLCTLYTEVEGSKKPMQVSRKLVVE